MQKAKYRIRRCNGNRRVWIMLTLRDDGTELDVSGSFWTSMTIDGLLARIVRIGSDEACVELLWTAC